MEKYLTATVKVRSDSDREKYELNETRRYRWNQLKKEMVQVMRYYKQDNNILISQAFVELETIGMNTSDLYYIKSLAMKKNYTSFYDLVHATGNVYHLYRYFSTHDKRIKFKYFIASDYFGLSKPTEMLFRTFAGCTGYMDQGHRDAIYYNATSADIQEYLQLRTKLYANEFLFSQLQGKLIDNLATCTDEFFKKKIGIKKLIHILKKVSIL